MSDLIKLGGNLESPRDAKATDWPNIGSTKPKDFTAGQDQLIKLTSEQEGPRHTEDGGDGQPVPTDRGAVVAKHFKVAKNSEGNKSVSFKGSVDLKSGQMVPCARDEKY